MSADELRESDTTAMSEAEIAAFLTDQGVGVLGVADEDLPYLVPMSFGFDGDRSLYFVFVLFGTESRKETLADRAERARFLVYDAESMSDWQSVSLVGRIGAVDDDEWDDLRTAMQNAWHPNLFSTANPMRGVRGYEFSIEEWSGIRGAE